MLKRNLMFFATLTSTVLASGLAHADFGQTVEDLMAAKSRQLFGFIAPLEQSATGSTPRPAPFDQPADARQIVDLAPGLHARILTREAANHADMFAFYPAEHPTHLVFCIEGGRVADSEGKPLNPSIQAINMKTGKVDTILWGMNRCDGIRATAWGTILATEETNDGSGYEILNPLADKDHDGDFDDYFVLDRGGAGENAQIVDKDGFPGPAAQAIVKRTALPAMAWEGLAVLETGVIYGGDELRPGTGRQDKDGGGLFKFIPSTPHYGGKIHNLADSPLAAGNVYAFRADCQSESSSHFPQYGQGCEIGNGSWVMVSAANARDDADANQATGYYRPEDMDIDPLYDGDGVRFCWTNTGNEGGKNYAEVMCGIDRNPLEADVKADNFSPTVEVNRFVEGDEDFNSFDNVGFQPETGNLYVIEDHPNGDIFACLPDGEDRNLKTDGCERILSVKDASAEPTGFAFHPSGRWAYVSIQHSAPSDLADTDDILIIEGFRLDGMERRHHHHHRDRDHDRRGRRW